MVTKNLLSKFNADENAILCYWSFSPSTVNVQYPIPEVTNVESGL